MKKRANTSPTHHPKFWANHCRALPVYLITALFLYATPFRLEALDLINHLHSENSPHNALTLGGIL